MISREFIYEFSNFDDIFTRENDILRRAHDKKSRPHDSLLTMHCISVSALDILCAYINKSNIYVEVQPYTYITSE